MPGLVAFGRRWSVGSDDLFLPSVCLCFLHTLCLTAAIIALVLDWTEITGGSLKGQCGSTLVYLMPSAILLLTSGFILTLSLMIVSLRGSILNDAPRKPAQYLIYILLVILVSKLAWSGFAVFWIHNFYFQCPIAVTRQVALGLVSCTWFVLLSVIITAWCTYDGAGRSWIKMKRYTANRKEFELKYPTYKRSGSRYRNWRQRKVIRAYQDSWNHRCRLLFCCIHRNERNRDSFADLARLLSEFFRDLDVVPSDVVVALVLLRRLQRLEQCSIVKQKRNNTYEFLSGVAITSKTKFVAMNDPKDLETFRNVVHFMHYASAAYGWPWYLIPNGLKGVCNLCSNLTCSCAGRQDLAGIVVEDNCCYCNYAVIPTTFDPDTFAVVHATYHVDVGETPFFVVVDYEKEAIVVSIRGTLSLKDVITDLNAEGEPLPVDPPREDWIGHKGIVAAAVYMKMKLESDQLIEKALNLSPERGTAAYRLVLVGHSLGAGTAAILAVLLRDQYPTLQCYAFSPPGGLLSMPVVEYTKDFVTSVIVGKDLVPRIGLSQMEALRHDLINAMKKSSKPKWQTLMSGMACCCCVKPEFAMPQRLSSAPSIQSEEFMKTRRSLKDLREVTINPNESAISLTVHQPLYPPGRIMHIVRHHPKKDEIKYEPLWRRVIKKEPVFQALWTENTDYGQVLISPGMIDDHMPHQVLRALHRVVANPGPAKPQRNLAASASPLVLSKESLFDEPLRHSGPRNSKPSTSSPHRVCMETSFTNNCSPTRYYTPECCTLMNPSPLIIDADADMDVEDDGELTPNNEDLNGILSSLNLSWDYVTKLQDKFLEKETSSSSLPHQHFPPRLPFPYHHERRSSIGNSSSSGCSDDAGSTFKEIFGPLNKYEDWSCPLASPETLSEISSLSSRASFFLPKDQASPLLRMKGGRHSNSSSLHRHFPNGKPGHQAGGAQTSAITNHNRSFSCTYPENGTEVSIIASSSLLDQKPKSNGEENHNGEAFYHESTNTLYQEDGLAQASVITVDETQPNPPRKVNGEATTKRVSFNLKRKYASKDSGCSLDESMSFPTTPAGRSTPYEPTYAMFAHQEPPYTYCGQSPIDSPSVIFPSCSSPQKAGSSSRFPFPDPNSGNGSNPVLHSAENPDTPPPETHH